MKELEVYKEEAGAHLRRAVTGLDFVRSVKIISGNPGEIVCFCG